MNESTGSLTSEVLYRRFAKKCEEALGPGAQEGLDSRSTGAAYMLPWVADEEGAIKAARVFFDVYAPGAFRGKGSLKDGEETLAGSLIVFLNEYMPPYDRTLKGMETLAGMESFEVKVSPLRLVFNELETGERLVCEDSQAGDSRMPLFADEPSPRAVYSSSPEGMVRLGSRLRRKSDGARPVRARRADGTRGFDAEDDVSLRLFERYLAMRKVDRMEAIAAVKAALSYAFHPVSIAAHEVSYSLLDALEASAHRAALEDGSNGPRALEESRLALERCKCALNDGMKQGGC